MFSFNLYNRFYNNRIISRFIVLFFIFFGGYSCNSQLIRSNLLSDVFSGSKNTCSNPLVANLLQKVSFNLICSNDFGSTYEVKVYAFPGKSRMGAYPNVILNTNWSESQIYYTNDSQNPSKDSTRYTNPIQIQAPEITGADSGSLSSGGDVDTVLLRFNATDNQSELVFPQSESYIFNSSLPIITFSNLNSHYISKSGRTNVSFTAITNVPGSYNIEIEGSSLDANSQKVPKSLQNGSLLANTPRIFTFAASNFLPGENRLYFYFTDPATNLKAYSSFIVYLDAQAPFTQATPDQGGYKTPITVSLQTLEPADIQYRLVAGESIPAATATTTYLAPIRIPSANFTLPEVYEFNYVLDYVATDVALNTAARITKTYRIDNKPPEVTECDGVIPIANLQNGSYLDRGVDYYVRSMGKVAAQYTLNENIKYFVEVGYNPQPDNGPILNQIVASSSFSNTNDCLYIDLLGTYLSQGVKTAQTVRIYFEDIAGNRSVKSYNFYLDNEVVTPALSSPFSGYELSNTGTAFPAKFTWKTVAIDYSGISGYQLELSNSIAFTSPTVFNVSVGNPSAPTNKGVSTTFNLTQLQYDQAFPSFKGRIYWRVKATDLVGNISAASGPRPLLINYSDASLDFDAIPDLMVGASGYSSNKGRVYILRGSGSCGTSGGVCNQDAGTGQWVIDSSSSSIVYAIINGSQLGERFGNKVSYVGDINGGGVTDFLVSTNPTVSSVRRVYLFLGERLQAQCPQSRLTVCDIEASSLTPIILQGISNDFFGEVVSYAGDYNGDGISDFAISAYTSPSNPANTGAGSFNTGVVYIYYGSAGNKYVSSAPNYDLLLVGDSPNENFGRSVCYVGDVNGDGYGDLFVGSPNGYSLVDRNTNQAPSGVGGIFYGDAPNRVNALLDVPFYGSEFSGSQFGSTCTRAHDTDGDGYEDVLVGAPSYSGAIGTNAGKAYLYFGNDRLFTVPAYQFQYGAANGVLGSSLIAPFLSNRVSEPGSLTSFLFGAPGINNRSNIYLFTNTGLNKPALALRAAPTATDFETFSFSNGDDVITQELASALPFKNILPSSMALWNYGTFVIADPNINTILIYRIDYSVTPAAYTTDIVKIVGSSVGEQFGSSISLFP